MAVSQTWMQPKFQLRGRRNDLECHVDCPQVGVWSPKGWQRMRSTHRISGISERFKMAAGDPPIWSWFGASAGGEERRPIDLKKHPKSEGHVWELEGTLHLREAPEEVFLGQSWNFAKSHNAKHRLLHQLHGPHWTSEAKVWPVLKPPPDWKSDLDVLPGKPLFVLPFSPIPPPLLLHVPLAKERRRQIK